MQPVDFYLAIGGWLFLLSLLLLALKECHARTDEDKTETEHDRYCSEDPDTIERAGGPKHSDDTLY